MKHDSSEKYDPADIVSKDIDHRRMNNVYFDALCRFAKLKGVNEDEAKDIVQDVFKKLLENRENIHIKGKLSSYLYQGVEYGCINLLGKKNVRRKYEEQITNKHEWLHLHYDNPFNMFITKELEQIIEKAIEVLPEKCRKVFLMVRDEGFQHKEVANMLKINIKTVSAHMDRAMKKIRKACEKNMGYTIN